MKTKPPQRFLCNQPSHLGIWTSKSSPGVSNLQPRLNHCSEVYSCSSHPWVHSGNWETSEASQYSPPLPKSVVLNLEQTSESPGGLFTACCLHPLIVDSVRLGWNLQGCISDELPYGALAACPGAHFESSCQRYYHSFGSGNFIFLVLLRMYGQIPCEAIQSKAFVC